jgi:hypothetical protein
LAFFEEVPVAMKCRSFGGFPACNRSKQPQLQGVAAIETSVVVMLRELAFRVTQIARSCADKKSVDQLTELSFELMVRAKDHEELSALPQSH